MTARLTTFAPGRNCDTANASLNSCAVIHRLSSTMVRRAHGSTPPKPCSAMEKKARNSSEREGGGVSVEAGESVMREVVAPGDRLRHGYADPNIAASFHKASWKRPGLTLSS